MESSVPPPDSAHPAAAAATKVENIKYLNAISFLLTACIVIGVVLGRAREEGVFGDEFLWMKYQTLITPSTYVNLIWIPLFLLQGLFIYASTIHKTLQTSPLVGYTAAALPTGSVKQSIVMNYPGICAATLMMVLSHDHGFILLALVASVLCGAILANVLSIQGEVLNEMEEQISKCDVSVGDDTVIAMVASNVKTRALQYIALRLPFELFGGYILACIALYFNTLLTSSAMPSMVYLIVANASLVGLLGAGFMLLWKIPGQKFYGVGISLVWYLLGVTIELHEPTQPIYNEFSDGSILTTQIVAGVASTVLMILLGVRVMKTMIKHNLFTFSGRLGGDKSDVSTVDDGGITADYVHA